MPDQPKGWVQVKVWLAPVDWDQSTPEGLDQYEKIRLASMSEHRANAFITGRCLLKALLAEETAISPGKVTIRVTESGALKPFQNLSVSISHSHNYVAAAVSGASAIGIDIESTDRDVDIARLVKRRFHPDEAAMVTNCLDSGHIKEARRRFSLLWSAKEALVKARDGRLLAALAERVTPDHAAQNWSDPTFLWRACGGGEWISVRELTGLSHTLAVVSGENAPDVAIRDMSSETNQ